MKSIVWKSLLLPVFAAALIFCVSSRAFGQKGRVILDSINPCLVDTGTNFIFTCEGFSDCDTFITFFNSRFYDIEVTGPFKWLSGDSEIFSLPEISFPFFLNTGDVYQLPIHIQFQCPPTKDVYSATFGIYSGSTLCAIDTFTLHVIFPITDTITLDVPLSGTDTISFTPNLARSRHVIRLHDAGANNVFLNSLQINDISNIAYFGQEGVKTFDINNGLIAGQSNDSAVMTLYPTDTGTYDIGLLLNYNNGLSQPYTLQVSISGNSLNSYPMEYEIPSFDTLRANQQLCQRYFVNNNNDDTIRIMQIILNDDPRSGVQWSLDGPPKLPDALAPETALSLGSICALATAADTIQLTGSIEIIYTYPCGTDTVTFPLNGKLNTFPQASVSEYSPQPAGFTISPNPTSGDVTISLPNDDNSSVEIFDVLGNLLLSRQASGEFVWNPETPNGTAANGTYIIRVTERGADGRFAVSSQRLLFVR